MRKFWTILSTMLFAACTPLSAFNKLAPKDPPGGPPVRSVVFGEGQRHKLDVYPTKAAAPAPVIVFFYGGGWSSGRRQDYAWAARAFAAHGFMTIVPDYRLVPEAHFPDFVEDSAAAIAWASKHAAHYGGDPSRLVLVGHSAGAYNAVLLAMDERYLSAVGASAEAVRGVVGLAGPYDFYPFDVAASKAAFGAYAHPLETQPVTHARAGAPPLLLLHGENDRVVRKRNALSLAEKVQAAGGEATTIFYPDVDHVQILLALSRPFRRRAPVLEDVVQFAKRVTN